MTVPTKIGLYEIIRELEGPILSEVFLAREPSTSRQVVIKRLRKQDLRSEETLLRYKREVSFLVRLENAPIVPMYDYNDRSSVGL